MKRRRFIVWLVFASLATLPAIAGCSASAKGVDRLPFYEEADFTPKWTNSSSHHIADFSLVAEDGSPFTRANLDGRIHIANFMFAQCPTICPMVTTNLKRVQDAIGGPSVMLVSFTVTPAVDTPAVLSAFGKRRGIDPAKWRLVTGDRDTIYHLARQSYFADDSRVSKPDDAILHSEKVLLVDPQGRLRGVYNGTSVFEMEKLVDDVRTLERESAGGAR